MKTSIAQYTDLYDTNRAAIDAGSAPVLNALRPAAREALAGASLPEKGDEGFEITSVNSMLAPDYGLNISRIKIPVDVADTFRCDVPNMSSLMGVVANDKFVPTAGLLRNLPEGVIVMSLAEAAKAYPDRVASLYGTIAPLSNPVVALDTMLVQDGVYIRVEAGVKLDRPLQIVNIFQSSVPLMAVRRILIDIDRDADLRLLLCDHSRNAGMDYLSLQVTEASLAPGARLEIYDLEESTATTNRLSLTYVRQQERSAFLANTTTLLNGTTRNRYNVDILGERCSTGLYGMAIGSAKQHVDNSTVINHRAPRSVSNQLYRYVLDDDARGAFEGLIEVFPEAPFTEAFQTNNNILASTGAQMHAKPQLIINNDDVKCSHGATTGQLNREALFYMRSRGIPEAEARTMLMQAFMVDVINTVSVEALRDRLRHLVEKRFAGTLGTCETCRKSNS
ncbi:MAG: SufD family Fe-S cluster assembly protein [Muribaculaceae bacterium]|nr:SufD family Fe-S cluster assembly protein [Muribaculaceae bacterium]